jgi:hypothetical protein
LNIPSRVLNPDVLGGDRYPAIPARTDCHPGPGSSGWRLEWKDQ